ncbi:MAG: hypothetical protein Q9178_002134 [Gyalolechia marmorata]
MVKVFTYGLDITSFFAHIAAIKAGTGRHMITLTIDQIESFVKLRLSDATYTSVGIGVWVNVECNIGILSACLPILRPLFSTKYASSPISRLTRIFHTLTNSHFSSSSRENLTSDPEKGTSEPSSDAKTAKGFKWLNHTTAGGGRRGSRNNSCRVPDIMSPAQGRSFIEPIGSRRTVALGERQKKQRTWYTAAAETLPEIDLQKPWSRKAIDTDLIPRYRDDNKPSPTKTVETIAPAVEVEDKQSWQTADLDTEQCEAESTKLIGTDKGHVESDAQCSVLGSR